MKQVKVIPYRCWIGPNGQKASIHGAMPLFNKTREEHAQAGWNIVEQGYTWEIVDYRGNVTYGACRAPAKTLEEANKIAEFLRS